MKVFISWSGDSSRELAIKLSDWIPSVIQAVKTFMSSTDIGSGERWSGQVGANLQASEFGILCVTAENKNAPWLNFEAGALSKNTDKSRVVPFLLNIPISQIDGPLAQFNAVVTPEKSEIKKLMKSINNALDSGKLSDSSLEAAFETWWPSLNEEIEDIVSAISRESKGAGKEKQKRTVDEILDEILSHVRVLRSSVDNAKGERLEESKGLMDQDLLSEWYLRSMLGKDSADSIKKFESTMAGNSTGIKALRKALIESNIKKPEEKP